MKKETKNTKLKLMSIITERIVDFVNEEDYKKINGTIKSKKTEEPITEVQLNEYIEEIQIDEEVGFVTIREMRKIIKDLIKNGINDEY